MRIRRSQPNATPLRLATACALLTLLALIAASATAGTTARPEGARVYIVSPAHGESVRSPVKVVFGLHEMGVAPASIQRDATGHHHLLIDVPLPSPDQAIPSDEHHRHFGGGQTEVLLNLAPGKHTLQLLLGDFIHVPHDPPVASEVITIEVVE